MKWLPIVLRVWRDFECQSCDRMAMFLFDPDHNRFDAESGRYGAPLARPDDVVVSDLATFATGTVCHFMVPDPPGDPKACMRQKTPDVSTTRCRR